MNTRKVSKRFWAVFLALVMLAGLPLTGLAVSVSMPEVGLSVAFPDSLDVFTRGMDENDPLLKLYGKTAGQVADELNAAGLLAQAFDIAGAFSITLAVTPGSYPDYGSIDEETLKDSAQALGSSEYTLIEISQGHVLLVKPDAGHLVVARYQGSSLAFELRLTTGGRVRSAMVSTMKSILRRVDITLGQ